MPLLFPTQGTLHDVFSHKVPFCHAPSTSGPPKRGSYKARSDLYPAWSAVDDVKSKAGQLTEEAQREYTNASKAAQQKAGQIELYSPKYYAACTLGGLLACVGVHMRLEPEYALMNEAGHYSHRSDSLGSGQMSPPGRFKDVQGQL